MDEWMSEWIWMNEQTKKELGRGSSSSISFLLLPEDRGLQYSHRKHQTQLIVILGDPKQVSHVWWVLMLHPFLGARAYASSAVSSVVSEVLGITPYWPRHQQVHHKCHFFLPPFFLCCALFILTICKDPQPQDFLSYEHWHLLSLTRERSYPGNGDVLWWEAGGIN